MKSLFNKLQSLWSEEVKPIMLKEWVHIFNDSATLRIALIIPLFQLTVFGFAINNEVRDVSTYIFDQSRSSLSAQLIEKAEATTYFKIKKFVFSKQALIDSLVEGKANVGIVIPPNFNQALKQLRSVPIQVLVNGSDSTVASQASSAIQGLTDSMSRELRAKEQLSGTEKNNKPLIEVRTRFLFNPKLETSFLIVPGLLGIIVFVVTSFLCSLSVVGEKERGTLEQLMVTPISAVGLMGGKLIPYMLIGLFDLNLCLLLMYVIFQIPINGNIFLLELATIIFMFSSLGVSLVASAISQTQAQASQLVMMQMLPSILLSGYVFPFESMPIFFKVLGYLLPVTHFINISRGIILRGAE
ncbi:MAG TPA: ABC transporter permease, partial [Vampirovibrionales bacterium]